jgi:hypothetical protein
MLTYEVDKCVETPVREHAALRDDTDVDEHATGVTPVGKGTREGIGSGAGGESDEECIQAM